MNKKYLILGIVLLLAVGFTNMARANSFNDILNTLSNQLYWLRDNLTAQVKLQPAPSPYPPVSGFADTKPVTVRPVVEYYMQTCQQDSDCGIVNTDCCTCYNGGSNESMSAINRSYGESFMKNMMSYCGYAGMKCSGKNQCSQDAKLHSITCEKTSTTGGVSAKKCVVRYSGPFVKATSSLPEETSNRLKYFCDATKKSCTLIDSSQAVWAKLYNTKEECESVCGQTTTTTRPTTTTSTSTTTTQPQAATDQWYKLTEFQGCKMDDWSKTCVDTNAAKSSGNEYKYCMNQYLLSQKITFTELTIKNMRNPGDVNCMACGCEMPDIYIKAKTNFESELNKIGFTKSSDPEAKAEEQAEGNKLLMDLSHQGLYYKEDRDTSKINYAIISKNDKVTCGDNVCHPRENYLYQIDLSKHCSALADKIINFDHCPQDCKNTFDTTKAVTKDEFNALEFSCKNQPKTEPTVITPKPVEQMTQTEKNNLIMQLQQQLLTLLVYLKDLLLAQR